METLKAGPGGGEQGSAGVDGVGVDDLRARLREQWPRIKEELLEGRCESRPVRKVGIPKPGGKGMRQLGIPTVVGRLIQQALDQVLQPVFDPDFSESSYGFRPGRGAHQAALKVRECAASGGRWVVDMDLEKFFERVNHDILMARVARKVADKRVLKLIRAMSLMKQGLSEERAWKSATNGRGRWWSSGASHMNRCFPKSFFDRLGLVSLPD